tara:strand:- start:1073 stop:1573 length:501 start_codon:yes stop_codon:yes gene_type:complete
MAIVQNNYITPAGYDRLVSERDHLIKTERPEVTKVVAWAASLGDRSENADYQYGKRRLREIDKRVAFLNSRINKANIVDPVSVKSDKVQFGATVETQDENDIAKTYHIVGEDEINPKQGLISWRSPIGAKLIGAKVGDIVTIKVPSGMLELEITKIAYLAIKIGES